MCSAASGKVYARQPDCITAKNKHVVPLNSDRSSAYVPQDQICLLPRWLTQLLGDPTYAGRSMLCHRRGFESKMLQIMKTDGPRPCVNFWI